MKNKFFCAFAAFCSGFLLIHSARAQGTAFTYQGQLNAGGAPANGSYDLQFTIYNSTNSPGTVIAGPLTNFAAAVSNGLFSTVIDFGNVFTGGSYWLDPPRRPHS